MPAVLFEAKQVLIGEAVTCRERGYATVEPAATPAHVNETCTGHGLLPPSRAERRWRVSPKPVAEAESRTIQLRTRRTLRLTCGASRLEEPRALRSDRLH